MENKGHKDRDRKRRHRGDDSHRHGAKTFRRGRAITFLERMELKRSTLKQQLETPELQSINPILVGELKTIDMVINEFVQLFELHEFEQLKTDKDREPAEVSDYEEKEID